MSDITYCADGKCPSRKTCIRQTHTGQRDHVSYAQFDREPDAEKCSYYEPNGKPDSRRTKSTV